MSMVPQIAALASSMQQQEVKAAAGMRVTRMAKESAENSGQQLVEMMEETTEALQQAVEAHKGQNINILV